MNTNYNPIKRPWILAMALLAALPIALKADVLELKNGTKVEGTIISEEGDSVQIETVNRRIKETKTYPRSEIANIIKLTPDQIAFDLLKPLAKSRDLLEPEEYDLIIKKRIQPFLEEFPTSPLKPEAEKLLAKYQEERSKARQGFRKYKGQWIPPADFENRGYLILAEVLENEFKDELKANDIPAAMRAFGQLEANHKATMNFHDSVIAAKKVLPQAVKVFQAAKARAEKAEADWKQRLLSNRQEERKLITAALKRDQTELDKMIKAEQAKGVKWITPHPTRDILNRDAYATLERLATTELQRLNGLRLSDIKEAAEAVQEAVKEISVPEPSEANLAAAETAIRKAAPILKDSSFLTTFRNRLTRERTAIGVREQAKKEAERRKIDAANAALSGGKELDVNPFAPTGKKPNRKRASNTGSGNRSTEQTSNSGGGGGGGAGVQDFSGGSNFLQYALMALGIIVVVFLVMKLKKSKAAG